MKKDIPGYEGLYQAHSDGYIISIERISPQKHLLPERILKTRPTSRGYHVAALCQNGKVKWWTVHRLIILTYVGESDLEVNHKDGNKLNNCIDNLEYVTRKQNALHAQQHELFYFSGPNNPNYKHGRYCK